MSDNSHNSNNPNDHRNLGTKLKLFMFNDSTPGMPFWLPNGARVRQRLDEFIRNEHIKRDYLPVLTPRMMKSDLWKTSGHYDNYYENMYSLTIDKGENLLAPMNCPGHVLCYKSDVHSYRAFPMKYFEFGQVHRHEQSGSLSGLFRVREFTQDDAHIFCTPEQIEKQIEEIMDFIEMLMETFSFKFEVEISTKPEKAVGSDENWNIATGAIRTALDNLNIKYNIDEGGGAFYGPKIDIKIKDSMKRKWQLSTVQVDFNLPERFDMEYIDENGQAKRPVMIHRAILGSFERFLGILLEHYKGELPSFISPHQLTLLPVSSEDEKQVEFCLKLQNEFKFEGVDADVNLKNETLGRRIKASEKGKACKIIVIGEDEVNGSVFKIRDKRRKEEVAVEQNNLLQLILNDIKLRKN